MAKSTRYVLSTNAHDGGDDRSDEARFGQKVTVLANGCWAWRNDLTQYGHFKRSTAGCDGPQNLQAHRFAYETIVGRIPEGHHLHHECENPGCVNPAHLVPLTPAEPTARPREMRAIA